MLQKSLCIAVMKVTFCASVTVAAGGPLAAHAEAPAYTADGKLILPADYREWVYLSSGLGMSYNPKALASPDPMFDNTFVNPQAYRWFRKLAPGRTRP